MICLFLSRCNATWAWHGRCQHLLLLFITTTWVPNPKFTVLRSTGPFLLIKIRCPSLHWMDILLPALFVNYPTKSILVGQLNTHLREPTLLFMEYTVSGTRATSIFVIGSSLTPIPRGSRIHVNSEALCSIQGFSATFFF